MTTHVRSRREDRPGYGDLTALNTCRLILDTVGKSTLREIANNYLDLLKTSGAIYEGNGDYALGIFSSGWCQYLDSASRELCDTEDNGSALKSGKWICHDCCWEKTSLVSIEKKTPIETECKGGLHLYAVPIIANGKAIGSMNVGYGTPPKEKEKLIEISELYEVDLEILTRLATEYTPSSPQIIKAAKAQLATSAKLIGQIIERKQANDQFRHSHDLMHDVISHARSAIAVHDRDLKYVYVSDRYLKEYNVKEQNVIGKHHYEVFPDLPQKWRDVHQRALAGEVSSAEEDPYVREDGSVDWTRWECRPWYEYDGSIGGIIIYTEVITERKRAEEERQKLQAQLLQAQKMETIGQLAGGVAHDFNNMLGVIMGHAELAMTKVDPAQPLHNDLQEILQAAQRSADLTRQLLAFARKQPVSPNVLDLNEMVSGMLNMLKRIMGEDIHLDWIPGVELWPIKMDPIQIDQVLANLSVNARDAIAGVGSLIIETKNVAFDPGYCADHAGFVPGEYVELSVSDTGTGMDSATLKHLFEPFFTTKEIGKGTGLGLATIYGIIKQNNGFINVYSEPGHGTTFKIYLPRHLGKIAQTQIEVPKETVNHGEETLLLVEDEPVLLNMSKVMLERLGYRVLPAGSPSEAIGLAQKHAGDIHLLLTDVVMPQINGRELVKIVASINPDLKHLFMSGYTANVIAHHGVLDKGVAFIQKPFSMKDLATKIREVLNQTKAI